MDAKTNKAIEARIAKAETIGLAIDAEVDAIGALAEKIREETIGSVLFELLESLAEGESLEQAIESIHSNF